MICKAEILDILASNWGVSNFLHDIFRKMWYPNLCHTITIYQAVAAFMLIAHLLKCCHSLHVIRIIKLPVQMQTLYVDITGVLEWISNASLAGTISWSQMKSWLPLP